VARIQQLLLYIAPIFVIFGGLLIANLRYSASPITASTKINLSDKMGGDGYRSVAYYCNWAIYGRKYRPQDLPADKLTHVLYAFANVRPESGEVSADNLSCYPLSPPRRVQPLMLTIFDSYLTDGWADTDIHWADSGDSWNDVGTNLYGCLKQLNLLKQRNRSLKVLLSIGGWTYSSNFPVAASTAAGRQKFASSAVELIKNLGFDGLDIDWEYPKSQNEARDFVELLRACRQAMDTYSSTLPHPHHFELTVACPCGSQNYNNMDIRGMDQYLDFWNLMAYDYAGSWDTHAGHQANIWPTGNTKATPFNTEQAVQHYISQGVQASKLVLGIPLYGRAFENTDGPGHPFQGVGEGSWESGTWDFKALPLPGSQVLYDDAAGASYSYDGAKRRLVSFDTVEMGRRKAEWIKGHGLGGAMFWESSADRTGGESLIGGVVSCFSSLDQRRNCLEYPESKYDNLRNGFK
jgi:chitinase